MLTCSRAFSTDSNAQGSEPSAPPCAAAITRSASMIPAIGARTMGSSVLKSARSRRSGHMVSSFRVEGDRHGRLCQSREEISTPDAMELCQVLCHGLLPGAPAPQRHDSPDGLNQSERPRALQEPVNRAQCAGDGESEDERMAAVLPRGL